MHYRNGRIALTSPSDPCPDLKACLHVDDVKGVCGGDVPDSTQGGE